MTGTALAPQRRHGTALAVRATNNLLPHGARVWEAGLTLPPGLTEQQLTEVASVVLGLTDAIRWCWFDLLAYWQDHHGESFAQVEELALRQWGWSHKTCLNGASVARAWPPGLRMVDGQPMKSMIASETAGLVNRPETRNIGRNLAQKAERRGWTRADLRLELDRLAEHEAAQLPVVPIEPANDVPGGVVEFRAPERRFAVTFAVSMRDYDEATVALLLVDPITRALWPAVLSGIQVREVTDGES